ncbi:FtsX-like permease family protein [Clostridium oceanicum]|uniref:ABC transporter permease n=1 Tax=Clostridium oceanicum TaxID=1543 RepID=A0ABP3UPQ8_9CLOT
MNLASLAYKNVKRNFYNYFLYFISVVFNIMLYFTFASVQYNDQVLKMAEGMDKLSKVFKGASIMIALFAALFIWYSSSFFIKKRKKEIGLYSLLGLKKSQIGKMLFYENLVIGGLALIVGIVLGTLLSKGFIMLMMKVMAVDGLVTFKLIPKAMIQTAIVFTILFFLTSTYGASTIYRYKLIQLFKADKTGEKQPKASSIFAIISVIMIVLCYLLVLKFEVGFMVKLVGGLILAVIGTFGVFSSFTIFAIKISKKNKKKHYKNINMIGSSQLLYRIKANARTLATIALLTATTLTCMGTAAVFYYDVTANISKEFPVTMAYHDNSKELDKKVEDIIARYPEHKKEDTVEANFLKISGSMPNTHKDERKTKGPFNKLYKVFVLKESEFRDIYKKTRKDIDKIPKLSNENETIIFTEFFNNKFEDTYKGKTAKVISNNKLKKDLKVKYFENSTLISKNVTGDIVVVKDNLYDKLYSKDSFYRIKGYMIKSPRKAKALEEDLQKIKPKQPPIKSFDDSYYVYSSYTSQYIGGMMGTGMLVFIGGAIGLIFLISTGSIIFFKQLSEAEDDKGMYKILRKIGVSSKLIKGSIRKQMLFIFGSPLVLGIIHSLVAFTFLSDMLNKNLFTPIFTTFVVYAVIYIFYYFLTVYYYTNIVNEK